MTAQPYQHEQHDANDILMGGGGAPTARFDIGNPGITVGGPIVAKPRAHQEREFDRNNPGKGPLKFFPSGDPIMGLTVDVQTNLRDPSISEDSGVRRIYIEGKRLKEAVRNAVRNAGAPGLEVAGELHVTYTGREADEHGQITDLSPKLWSVRYVPAASAVLMNEQPVQQPGQPQAAPVQQQAPVQAAPINGPTPEAIAALKAAGVNPATVYPGWTG